MMLFGRLKPDRKRKRKSKLASLDISIENSELVNVPKKQKMPVSPSLLEALPRELLQDIFLFSANVQLPLCSRQLLSALSSEHLKFELALQILVYQKDKLEKEDKSLLLSRRFFNWDFVVRYVHFARTRVRGAINSDTTSDSDSSSEDDTASHADREPSRRAQVTQAKSPPSSLFELDRKLTNLTFNALEELRRDDVGHLLGIEEGVHPYINELQSTRGLTGLQLLHIPSPLLHGDWNDDRTRVLRLLILFNCSVKPHSPASEIARAGLHQAIASANAEVVSHFLGAHIDVNPSTEALRLAMKTSNLSIIFQVLRANSGEIDVMDKDVWRLLEDHAAWGASTKAKVQGWLRKEGQLTLEEENMVFLPKLKEIEVEASRWTE